MEAGEGPIRGACICRHEPLRERHTSGTLFYFFSVVPVFAVVVLIEIPMLMDKAEWSQGAWWTCRR